MISLWGGGVPGNDDLYSWNWILELIEDYGLTKRSIYIHFNSKVSLDMKESQDEGSVFQTCPPAYILRSKFNFLFFEMTSRKWFLS